MNKDNKQDRIIHEELKRGQRATLNGMRIKRWVTEQETYLRRIRSRNSPKVWLIKLFIILQNMTHNRWKTRNEAPVYKKEDSTLNKQRHGELDQDIFRDRSHFKLLPSCDAAFFRRGQAKIKWFRVKEKEIRVNYAKKILEAYNDSLDATSKAFLDFFVIPRNTMWSKISCPPDARVWIYHSHPHVELHLSST